MTLREHLSQTQQFEHRLQNRPLFIDKDKDLVLNIQSGRHFYSKMEDGAHKTVQILKRDTITNSDFDKNFKEYEDKNLGWINVPVEDLEAYLKKGKTKETPKKAEPKKGTEKKPEKETSKASEKKETPKKDQKTKK